MDTKTAFARLVAIATADPRELVELRRGCCRHCNGEGGRYQWREEEYLAALQEATTARPPQPVPDIAGGFGFQRFGPLNVDCKECGGAGVPVAVFKDTDALSDSALLLYRGVKQTRQGLELIMADQDAALRDAIRMLGGFNDRLITGDAENPLDGMGLDIDQHEAARRYELMMRNAAGAKGSTH